MKLGLLGVGHQGKKYIETCNKLGIPLAWASNKPRFDAEAIIIATPAESHYRLAWEALLYGCHVLIEKPMTMDVIQAEELYRLAKFQRVTGFVDHTHLYSPAWRRIKSLAHGVVGAHFKAGGPCKADPKWDWGSHGAALCLDIGAAYTVYSSEIVDERVPLTLDITCRDWSLRYDDPITDQRPMEILMREFMAACKKGNDQSGIKMGVEVARVITCA